MAWLDANGLTRLAALLAPYAGAPTLRLMPNGIADATYLCRPTNPDRIDRAIYTTN